MSLFGLALKKGAQFADGLLDDVAIQAKQVGEVDWNARYAEARKLDAENWDEASWISENPHPVKGWPDRPVNDFSDEERKLHNRWRNKKSHATHKNVRLLDADKRNSDPEVRKRKNQREMERHNRLKDDPDYIRKKREQYERDKDRRRANARQHYADNRERQIELSRLYRERNKEEIRRKQREAYKRNPELWKMHADIRRAVKLERTVPWADYDEMAEIYKISRQVSELTGNQHHVDHMLPLRGKSAGESSVSGLHHQDNLLIIPAEDNLRKSNHFAPGTDVGMGGVGAARSLLDEILKAHPSK